MPQIIEWFHERAVKEVIQFQEGIVRKNKWHSKRHLSKCQPIRANLRAKSVDRNQSWQIVVFGTESIQSKCGRVGLHKTGHWSNSSWAWKKAFIQRLWNPSAFSEAVCGGCFQRLNIESFIERCLLAARLES